MIYIFYKMLMFKMLNMNECIFWCECVCVMGGWGGGWGGGGWGGVGGGGVGVGGGGGGGGWGGGVGGWGGMAFILSLQLLINSVWKCRLI